MPVDIEVPNAVTQKAIDELESGEGVKFKSIKSLMDDLNADDSL